MTRVSIPSGNSSVHPVRRNSNVSGTSHDSKAHRACRACGHAGLQPYLDFGNQAPANALRYPGEKGPEFTAHLSIAWCPECGLSQLEQVVNPSILYTDYPFRAGISRAWQAHCAMLMTSLELEADRKFLVDIGSNDGTLLWEAADRGWKVLGIDPCPANPAIPMLSVLWSSGVARRILQLHGRADVITATNVFGHVDDARDFLVGIKLLLKPHGIAIIECPHIFPLLEQVAFDTIYHEHLSYWSLRPLELLAESVGLKVIDVRMFSDLHGGTMRYTLTPGDRMTHVQTSVAGLRILESAQFQEGLTPYKVFATKAWEQMAAIRTTLQIHRQAARTNWGYGANAKGAVLLQGAHINAALLNYVVDDTPGKWDCLMPGTDIPIRDATDLATPDVLVLFSWNNAEELTEKARSRGFRGQVILPHLQVVDA